jgi:hypothetical protein
VGWVGVAVNRSWDGVQGEDSSLRFGEDILVHSMEFRTAYHEFMSRIFYWRRPDADVLFVEKNACLGRKDSHFICPSGRHI